MRAALLLCLGLLPGIAAAQTFGLTPSDDQGGFIIDPATRPRFDDTPRETVQYTRVASAPQALLRGLDKISGEVTDLPLSVGNSVRFGRLEIALEDCRYPVDNPSGDAFAYVVIRADGMSRPAFQGWMIASSPALSALDHPRYDVWVMRCSVS